MAHLSADQLAALASDPAHELEPGEREHLESCRACSDELDELAALVREVRLAGSTEVRRPRPEVWAGIERELEAETPAATRRAGTGRRRRFAVAAVAAAAGLVAGVGGTLGFEALRPADDGPALLASTVLTPLPGEVGEGTAQLFRDRDTLQLRVHATLAASPSQDYHEVWLVNGDGRRMYALGVLPSSGDASYWLPAPLDDRLDGYQIVDISLEPEDGDTAHSQHSLVRGQLPG